MAKLSVNINKLALLRNSRDKNNPDLLAWAKKLIDMGVPGITVHPRPDERHVRKADVTALGALIQSQSEKQTSTIEFNIEGYPSEDFNHLVLQTLPQQVTLVPDPPEALTSNAGWDFVKNKIRLREVTARFQKNGIRVSLFLDPATMNADQWQALSEIGCERIELYTESYADHFTTPAQNGVILTYQEAARKALTLGLQVNAGHDLNLNNLRPLISTVPEISEVSIGHALICEALDLGMSETIRRYLQILRG